MSLSDLLDDYNSLNDIPDEALHQKGLERYREDGAIRIRKIDQDKARKERRLAQRLNDQHPGYLHRSTRTYINIALNRLEPPSSERITHFEGAERRAKTFKERDIPPIFKPEYEGSHQWEDDSGIVHEGYPTIDQIINTFATSKDMLEAKASWAEPTTPKRVEHFAEYALADELTEHRVRRDILSRVETTFNYRFRDDEAKDYVLRQTTWAFNQLADDLRDYQDTDRDQLDEDNTYFGTRRFAYAFMPEAELQKRYRGFADSLVNRLATTTRGSVKQLAANHEDLKEAYHTGNALKDIVSIDDIHKQAALQAIHNDDVNRRLSKPMINAAGDDLDQALENYVRRNTEDKFERVEMSTHEFEEKFNHNYRKGLGQLTYQTLERIQQQERQDVVEHYRQTFTEAIPDPQDRIKMNRKHVAKEHFNAQPRSKRGQLVYEAISEQRERDRERRSQVNENDGENRITLRR